MNGTSLKDPPASIAGFPSSRVPPALVRVGRRANGPWWFSSDFSGRFDLPAPHGTCYLATDDVAAIREATRAGPVTPAWVDDRVLHDLAPPDPAGRVAATTHAAAAGFGLTKELATVLPYDCPQRWAAAFHRHGFAGIRLELRHDPRARPSGVAMFGPSGEAGLPSGTLRPLSTTDVRAAGVDVLPVPDSRSVTILGDTGKRHRRR